MDLLSKLTLGFHVATLGPNLLACLIGAMLGMLVGILPRLNLVGVLAMLLPAIYGLEAAQALIFLTAVFCGAQYGGVASAILVQHGTGETGTAMAGIEGNVMVQQGRSSTALMTAAMVSFFAGSLGVLVLALLAPALTAVAFNFGGAETVALIAVALVGAVALAAGSALKALAMMVWGLLLGQMGHDPSSGALRFLFEIPPLTQGSGFVPIVIGLLAGGEIIARLERGGIEARHLVTRDRPPLRVTRQDLLEAWPAMLRGTAIGAVLGALPGGGTSLAAFVAYLIETKAAREARIALGNGAVQGLAGPVAASNAGTQTSFIPMLTLGMPSNGAMALLFAGMSIKGVTAGPQLMTGKPELFWGLLVSLWIGNLMLLVLSPPVAGLLKRLLSLSYRSLFPLLLLLCCLGVYGLGRDQRDVFVFACSSVVGYLFYKLDCDLAPLLVGFVLAPVLEENLRHTLQLSNGDWATFVNRPLSGGLLALALLLLLTLVLPRTRSIRKRAYQRGS